MYLITNRAEQFNSPAQFEKFMNDNREWILQCFSTSVVNNQIVITAAFRGEIEESEIPSRLLAR